MYVCTCVCVCVCVCVCIHTYTHAHIYVDRLMIADLYRSGEFDVIPRGKRLVYQQQKEATASTYLQGEFDVIREESYHNVCQRTRTALACHLPPVH